MATAYPSILEKSATALRRLADFVQQLEPVLAPVGISAR